MLPVIAYNLLQSISLLANSCNALAEKCISDFVVNTKILEATLAINPILITALNQKIGYNKAAEIAKRAHEDKRSILAVAKEMTNLDETELKDLLDPANLV